MAYEMTLRRLRQSKHTRELTREVDVSSTQLIQPHFICEGLLKREAVPAMTGVFRETSESILQQIETDLEHGIDKIILFGVPKQKYSKTFQFDFMSKQIETIKSKFGSALWMSADVCLCSYTEHGHCGILNEQKDHLCNDETVQRLAEAALIYAQAGANCVAPSDMMDGRIHAIRDILAKNNLDSVLIMSYAAKFASKFYGPFRVAAESSPKGTLLNDRLSYQIDPARPSDAIASAIRDQSEGADILMVKPGLPYLDILKELSQTVRVPLSVYEVSGEYAAIELLAEKGLIDRAAGHKEAWTSLVRAGAQSIITYGARYAREWLARS